jgi:hypothetical protein
MAAGAYDANRARDNQEEEVASTGERNTSARHEGGTHNQHPSPPMAIGPGRKKQGDDYITRKREAEKQAGLCFAEPQAYKIENEDDRQCPVG